MALSGTARRNKLETRRASAWAKNPSPRWIKTHYCVIHSSLERMRCRHHLMDEICCDWRASSMQWMRHWQLRLLHCRLNLSCWRALSHSYEFFICLLRVCFRLLRFCVVLEEETWPFCAFLPSDVTHAWGSNVRCL